MLSQYNWLHIESTSIFLICFIFQAELGLNEHHQGIVKSYIQFARYLRLQNLKAIDMSIQDVLDTRY